MATDDVQDIVTVSDAVESINVTENDDKISVTEGADGQVVVQEVSELYEIQDQNDSYELVDSPDKVQTIDDAAIVVQKTIVVEPDDEVPLSQEVDFVGDTVIYKGWADPNSATADPVWKIQKIEFVGVDEDVVYRWAAAGLFTQIWDNRAGLTYS